MSTTETVQDVIEIPSYYTISLLVGTLCMVLIAVTVIGLLVNIITLFALTKVFEAAGIAGWKAIIPFYNLYLLFGIAWGKPWLFLMGLIPLIGLVIYIMMAFKLCQSFGKSVPFSIGMVLFPYIFIPVLGFGNVNYIGPSA